MTTTSTLVRARTSTVLALCVADFACLAALSGSITVGLFLLANDLHGDLSPEAALARMVAAGAVATLFGNPLFGWLGDRSVRRGGSRTWWIVGGAVAGGLGKAGMAGTETLTQATILWAVSHAGLHAAIVNLYGELTAVVPPSDRSWATAWFAGSATGAVVLGLGAAALLPKTLALQFGVLPLLAAVVTTVVGLHLRGVERTEGGERSVTDPATIGSAGAEDGRPGFWWVWTQRVAAQAAWGIAVSFGANLMVRRMGLTEEAASTIDATAGALTALLGAAIAIGVARGVVRRVGYRATVALGMCCVLAANLLMAVATVVPVFVAGALVAGVGIGLYVAVDLRLVLPLLPRGREGRYLGLFGVARTLPQVLLPLAAPLLLGAGDDLVGLDRSQNFAAYFAAGVVATVVALALVTRLPVPRDDARLAPVTA